MSSTANCATVDPPLGYRERLHRLDGPLFLTDGGIGTTLIFHHGLDLPEFAAFDLLAGHEGTQELRRYYEQGAGETGYVLREQPVAATRSATTSSSRSG